MAYFLGKSTKKGSKIAHFLSKKGVLQSVFLNIVTITEIYVLCVNDSELKRSSSLKHWYSIWELGMYVDE